MSDLDISYGGQAVIGGVLIQSPKGWSLGVRDKDNDLHRYYESRVPLVRRNKFWSSPFIRGFGALIDSMYVGFKAITLSEKIYSKYEDEEESLISKIITYTVLIAVLLLFIAGPRLLVETIGSSQVATGVVEGIFRGIIVIVYIYLIGRTKDAQELFEYHGAEHMTIASFEDKQSLEFDDVIKYPKEHIRCGTSFLFLIVFISLLTLPFIPNLNLVLTTITRLLHVVLVSMISYEVLKFNFKNSHSLIAKIFAAPGLWTQKITTKEPSADQIEVAILSMANCINNSEGSTRFDKILSKAQEVEIG
ncbi:MAG: DUF1385 domain-containing protein [Candidatus Actinomarina sp.]|jgi:uncharacterized protein YqhQ|tara:strand:+ start:1050 stop:1964 length:915 start_codon:yes stop_codon:yes gene_type:complete